jgi:hypothetical protein
MENNIVSTETRRQGWSFFTVNNWTAMCVAVLTTVALTSTIAAIGWSAWGRDKVDAQIDKKLLPIDARVAILETYIPQIEEALTRNAAEHQAIMSAAQRVKSEQIFQNMRRGTFRVSP